MPPKRRKRIIREREDGVMMDPRYVTTNVTGDARLVYNWPAIRELFVKGVKRGDDVWYPSPPELAEMIGARLPAIHDRCAKERWLTMRATHQYEIASERRRKHVMKMGEEAMGFDVRALDTAKMGIALIQTRLAEIVGDVNDAQERRTRAKMLIAAGMPHDPKDLYSAIYHQEIRSLAEALRVLQEVGMRAMGTDINRQEVLNVSTTSINGAEVKSVSSELMRDDAARAAAVLAAMGDAELLAIESAISDVVVGEVIDSDDDDEDDEEDIEEGEVVDDDG